jgi:predicted nucleic acid-binding protein
VSVVYDAGVFVAAERSNREVWADHRIRLELGIVPLTTGPVVAQVSRSDRQAQLRRFLRGCEILAFSPDQAHEVGAILAKSGTSDVVDAHLVITAATTTSAVLTSDLADLRKVAQQLVRPVSIRRF